MPVCFVCQSPIAVLAERPPRYCPRCGADGEGPEAQRWVTVAQVSNLAELGYCEDLLFAAGIEPLLRDDDNFDALHGVWRGVYSVCVRASRAQEAADLLENHLSTAGENSDPGEDAPTCDYQALDWSPSGRPDPLFAGDLAGKNASWAPWLACFLAGGIAAWGGISCWQAWQTDQRPMQPSDFWRAIQTLDRPLESPLAAGGQRIVVHNDRHSHSVWIEEDRDGDGQFDIRRRFQDGRLVER